MRLPRPVRGVLLDMDGTLCDTETLWKDAAFEVAAEMGLDLALEDYMTIVGVPLERGRVILAEVMGPGFPVDAWLAAASSRAEELAAGGVALKPGVVELLDAVHAAGMPAALCTSSSHRAVELHLGGSGVLERLDAVVAAGDYPHGKPAPDPYLVAAGRLGVGASECLALEDSANGVRSAHAAGCVTVMVPDLVPPTDEVRALCDLVAADLHEVVSALTAP